ncbi:MAG: hypothetical protein IPI59_00385 [Sphingobacteriales bacterium]|jgi:hypothetical protein|nr:hypothetical protein [Sphingobacteriales bacterium]MBP9141056.1 hypothetical protein [Chitinophagales bacterium]MDA0198278.1 hypothetical protein [Bacteroidota bacterium]MBK6890919.1 hypothetical protein [Sphingobacteriales bacterium]MBK7526030.1 hypothetical protein [Sphingobacteriales bacterium]
MNKQVFLLSFALITLCFTFTGCGTDEPSGDYPVTYKFNKVDNVGNQKTTVSVAGAQQPVANPPSSVVNNKVFTELATANAAYTSIVLTSAANAALTNSDTTINITYTVDANGIHTFKVPLLSGFKTVEAQLTGNDLKMPMIAAAWYLNNGSTPSILSAYGITNKIDPYEGIKDGEITSYKLADHLYIKD